MSDKLNTEELIRARLNGAELTPSPESWRAIQQKLRWPQFLRFNPGRFNIYYAGALLLAATGLVLLLAGEREKDEPTVPEEKTTIQSTTEQAVEEITGESVNETNNASRDTEMHPDTSTTPSQIEEEPDRERGNKVSNAGEEEERFESSLTNEEMVAAIPPEPTADQLLQQSPVTYFTSSIQSGCAPLTVQFTNQSVHATSFYWDFGTGANSQEQNPVYEFKEPGRYMVILTAENHGNHATVSRMMVEVLETPVADFQIEEGLEGVDNHVVLNLVNYSSDASVFAWNLVDEKCTNCSGWSSIEHQPTLELKTITPDSRSVKLEVINENGCSDMAVQQLPLIVQTSETRIKFATAFSPNPSGPGDGSFAPGSKRIDLFHPLYIEVPVEMHMRVFTRRGELVFETREVYQGWDGYMHQEGAPADVYVWMVEGKWKDGESFSLRGDVTLVWNQYW
ncbi:MAG: gliding motility-associated C-terminal domain-containing protein [Bacteroidales bacterium]|nr:gliding motility-associated C-terminal domain-containing protein [Bacteroidales bacterium]